MKRKKILIAPSTFAVADGTPLALLERAGCTITKNPYGRKLSRKELLQLLPGVTGIIAGLEPLDREVLENSDLRVISRCGAGIDNVDLQAAKEFGIRVRFTPDAPTEAVAELTVAMMIVLVRRIPQMDRSLHAGGWEKITGFQLRDRKVVIIGFGRIGRAVARMLKPFGPRIIAVDPLVDLSSEMDGEMKHLREALHDADIITLHASGERVVLDEEAFRLMKPGVIVLNAARGALINEGALIHALENGTVAAAWIDTFSEEPYKGPLKGFPQIVLTPHIASYSMQCRRVMELQSVENLLSALEE